MLAVTLEVREDGGADLHLTKEMLEHLALCDSNVAEVILLADKTLVLCKPTGAEPSELRQETQRHLRENLFERWTPDDE